MLIIACKNMIVVFNVNADQRAESRVKRPSNSEAAALASLFSSNITSKRPSFDPTSECRVTREEIGYKRGLHLSMLKNYTKALLKEKRRRLLMTQGRMKTVICSVTALQVKIVILCAYEDLQLTTFVGLDMTESGHHLINQYMCRRGYLYL